jgi:hypothetical protein
MRILLIFLGCFSLAYSQEFGMFKPLNMKECGIRTPVAKHCVPSISNLLIQKHGKIVVGGTYRPFYDSSKDCQELLYFELNSFGSNCFNKLVEQDGKIELQRLKNRSNQRFCNYFDFDLQADGYFIQDDTTNATSFYKNYSQVIQASESGTYFLVQRQVTGPYPFLAEILRSRSQISHKQDRSFSYIDEALAKRLVADDNGQILCMTESNSEDSQTSTPRHAFGYCKKNQQDCLMLWDCQADSKEIKPIPLIPDQKTFVELSSVSQNENLLCGAIHTHAKKVNQIYSLERNTVFPYIQSFDSNKPWSRVPGYQNLGVTNKILNIPGAATALSPDGEICFAMQTNPESHLAKSSNEDAYSDRVSIFMRQALNGYAYAPAARSVQATICLSKNTHLFPLKPILLDCLNSSRNVQELLQGSPQHIRDIEKQIAMLSKAHLVQVVKTTLDQDQNLVFVGIALDQKNRYRVFHYRIPTSLLKNELLFQKSKKISLPIKIEYIVLPKLSNSKFKAELSKDAVESLKLNEWGLNNEESRACTGVQIHQNSSGVCIDSISQNNQPQQYLLLRENTLCGKSKLKIGSNMAWQNEDRYRYDGNVYVGISSKPECKFELCKVLKDIIDQDYSMKVSSDPDCKTILNSKRELLELKLLALKNMGTRAYLLEHHKHNRLYLLKLPTRTKPGALFCIEGTKSKNLFVLIEDYINAKL